METGLPANILWYMASRLFESFCEMIETIPAKAIVRAAEAERRMVEDDLAKKRTSEEEDAISLLGFCDFLVDASNGLEFSFHNWPREHCECYRTIVQRLVETGELPFPVLEEFDTAFSETSATAV
jgi:hypothetical protein